MCCRISVGWLERGYKFSYLVNHSGVGYVWVSAGRMEVYFRRFSKSLGCRISVGWLERGDRFRSIHSEGRIIAGRWKLVGPRGAGY